MGFCLLGEGRGKLVERNVGGDCKRVLAEGVAVALADCPFPRALAELAAQQATGTLSLSSGHLRKTLILRDGVPAHVESNIAEESLHQYLVGRGEIGEDVAGQALVTATTTGRDVCDVLVEMQALRPDQLFKALQRCLGASILSTFAWREGEAVFAAGDPDSDGKIMLKVNPAPLIVRGVCSYAPIELVRADFTGSDLRYRLRSDVADLIPTLRLNTREGRVANALVRSHSRLELAAKSQLSDHAILRLLYALVILDIVEVAPEPSEERDRQVDDVGPAPPIPEPTPSPVARAAIAAPPAQITAPPDPEPESKSKSKSKSKSEPKPKPESEPKSKSKSKSKSRAKGAPDSAPARPSVRFAAASTSVLPELSDEQREAIDRTYLVAKTHDYFELLGVDQAVTFARLKRAFLALCDRYSPMSYRGYELGEHGDRLEELFLVLVRAFSTLAVPASRKSYLETISGETRSRARSDSQRREVRRSEPEGNVFAVDEPPGASVAIKTAITFINAGQPDQAVAGLRAAVEDNPDDVEAMSFLGYALYLSDPVSRLSEAVHQLQQAMTIDSRYLYEYLFLGRIFEVEQDRSSALGAYRECLRVAPDNHEARAAVERLEKLLGEH